MTAETATNGAVEPAEAKTTRSVGGRPVGYPKSGGRRKGPGNSVGKQGREWLAANSKTLDVLARVASGKGVKLAGPTGKRQWHYPSWADQKWACELLLPRLVPALSAAEFSGPDGGPITTEALLPMEAMQRLGALFAAVQTQTPAPPAGPPVIDVEAEPLAAPEDRSEAKGGRAASR